MHARAARARRALPPAQIRQLRAALDSDPRACRRDRTRRRWHSTSHHQEWADQLTGELAELYGALHGKAWVWRYDAETGRREAVREGTTSRLPWLGRWRYLNSTIPRRLAQSDAQAILSAHKLDPATFRRWARTESGYADQGTGRRVIVRAVTVADLMEVSERLVKVCRAVARALGLYATVHRGRMLRQMERIRDGWNGSRQRGVAAESWFVVPPDLAVPPPAEARRSPHSAAPGEAGELGPESSTESTGKAAGQGTVASLPSGRPPGHSQSDPESLVTLTTGRKKEPAPPAAMPKRRKRSPSPGYRLAERIVQTLPWAAGCPAGRLSGLLGRFALARLPWTAQDVAQHVDTVNRRRGWSSVAGTAELRAPAFALLASYLRDADPDADHPRLPELEEADRRQRAAARRAEHRRGGCTVPATADCCPICSERFT